MHVLLRTCGRQPRSARVRQGLAHSSIAVQLPANTQPAPVHPRTFPARTSCACVTRRARLQILEDTIKTRWNVLPEDQQKGIRQFLTNVIISVATTGDAKQRVYLHKLNLVLVQVRPAHLAHPQKDSLCVVAHPATASSAAAAATRRGVA